MRGGKKGVASGDRWRVRDAGTASFFLNKTAPYERHHAFNERLWNRLGERGRRATSRGPARQEPNDRVAGPTITGLCSRLSPRSEGNRVDGRAPCAARENIAVSRGGDATSVDASCRNCSSPGNYARAAYLRRRFPLGVPRAARGFLSGFLRSRRDNKEIERLSPGCVTTSLSRTTLFSISSFTLDHQLDEFFSVFSAHCKTVVTRWSRRARKNICLRSNYRACAIFYPRNDEFIIEL